MPYEKDEVDLWQDSIGEAWSKGEEELKLTLRIFADWLADNEQYYIYETPIREFVNAIGKWTYIKAPTERRRQLRLKVSLLEWIAWNIFRDPRKGEPKHLFNRRFNERLNVLRTPYAEAIGTVIIGIEYENRKRDLATFHQDGKCHPLNASEMRTVGHAL